MLKSVVSSDFGLGDAVIVVRVHVDQHPSDSEAIFIFEQAIGRPIVVNLFRALREVLLP